MMKLKYTILFLFLFAFLCPTAASAQAKSMKLTFNHAAICVRDLKTSTNFYKTTLGLEEIPNPFNDGAHTWLTIGPGLQLHIIQRACDITHNKNVHLCFSVASLSDFTSQLDKAKVAYTNLAGDSKVPTQRIDGVKQIYLQDPDGYWLEINDAK